MSRSVPTCRTVRRACRCAGRSCPSRLACSTAHSRPGTGVLAGCSTARLAMAARPASRCASQPPASCPHAPSGAWPGATQTFASRWAPSASRSATSSCSTGTGSSATWRPTAGRCRRRSTWAGLPRAARGRRRCATCSTTGSSAWASWTSATRTPRASTTTSTPTRRAGRSGPTPC